MSNDTSKTTLDDLVNMQTWFARGLDDGVAKERARCLRIVEETSAEFGAKGWSAEAAGIEIAAKIKGGE